MVPEELLSLEEPKPLLLLRVVVVEEGLQKQTLIVTQPQVIRVNTHHLEVGVEVEVVVVELIGELVVVV